MRTLESRIDIDASPEQVWAVLVDFPAYPAWNPFITSVDGEVVVGERLTVRLSPPGGRGMTFRPTVQVVEPARRFGWLGHLLVPRLFDGAHELLIEPRGDGGSTFVQREEFRGALVGLLGGTLDKTLAGFEAMNAALKTRVERGGHVDT